MLEMAGQSNHDLPLAQTLTPREQEMLNCLADGMSNRQIAEHLVVSINTVKWYVRQIYNKLGVDNRKAAVARARSLGLLPAGEQKARPKYNLPVAATPFVGREKELAALADLIADPQVRLVTLTGPGGIGKTRLALEAAGRQLGRDTQFPDGVFLISLAPIYMATEIVTTMAATLNFHFHGSENEKEQILNYLRQKQLLLVMDNFEHILDGRSILAEISAKASAVNLIVTSREPLQLQREQRFTLQGLEVPQSRDLIKDTISDYAAAQLFLNIARRTDPDFYLLPGDGQQLLNICRLVEGMPLGLELAASWVSLLPLSEIAAEIENSLDLLRTDNYDVPERHQSMQAALETSWRRLSPDQQLSFQQLTIFRGGFTRRAALKVTGSKLPLLVTLTNKSWLSYDRQNNRYHIHELLRQYGSGKLSSDKAKELKLKEKHSAYFCSYLKQREMALIGPQQQEMAAEIGDEIDNIHHGWRNATKAGYRRHIDKGLNCLCRFYRREGRNSDGRNACRLAVEGLSQQAAEQTEDNPVRLALLSRVLVWETFFVNEVDERVRLLDTSQGLLDQAVSTGHDTRFEQAFLFQAKARAVGMIDFDQAIQMGARAQKLYQELGDPLGESEALNFMGNRYTFLGAFNEAHEALSKSMKISRQIKDIHGIGDTTWNLGIVYQHQGKYEESEALHLQGLRISRDLQNQLLESNILTVLSFTYSWSGKFTAARETANQSLAIKRHLGGVRFLWSLIALCNASIHLGQYGETKAQATETLQFARQGGQSTEEGYALMYLGNVAHAGGDSALALIYLEKSARIMTEMRYVYQALPRACLCLVLRTSGKGRSARLNLARALRSAIEIHSETAVMYCLPAAALLAVDEGRRERASELYSLAQRFGHIANSHWFRQVACQELDDLRATLPSKVAEAAEARGRELDVWQTAESLVAQVEAAS
ncbi:MAG: tetratricopeptide repeat protein [Candidatus Promineifilaceae bacterium]|nr:tetratricopeptide repeat protein [Candidatus Promineifilaceae bacterium]